MPSLIPRAFDLDQAGFWGPVTSTLDWCEENYHISYFVAEWWNTISNIPFLIYAALGLYYGLRHKTEKRILAGYFALGVVGIGSMLFHATLHLHYQYVDEVSMIWGMSAGLFGLQFTFPPDRNMKMWAIGLMCYALLTTLVYCNWGEVWFHWFAYGCLTLIVGGRPGAMLQRLHREGKINDVELKRGRRLWLSAIGSYVLGMVVWSVENAYCDLFRSFRDNVGYPIRVVAELHAWWHLLTSFGAYSLSVLGEYMRFQALGRKDMEIRRLAGIMPVIRKAEDASTAYARRSGKKAA